jgi:hypothetical protein
VNSMNNMKRVTQFKKGEKWITLPSTTYRGLIKFILLGSWDALFLVDSQGNSSIVERMKTDEREKLLATIA